MFSGPDGITVGVDEGMIFILMPFERVIHVPPFCDSLKLCEKLVGVDVAICCVISDPYKMNER
jgi:hypothetical protein